MDYTTALSKGCSLLHLLDATTDSSPTTTTTDSPFVTPSALSTWGYTQNDYSYTASANLDSIQTALGIDPAQNIAIGHSHVDSCIQNDVYVPVTWAKFNTIVNAAGGMLIAVDNESPTALVRLRSGRKTFATPLPDLRFWSDVAFLQWIAVTKGAAELRYVVRLGIMNAATMAVVRHLLERDGRWEIEKGMGWPDVTWRDEEAVAALLGTPNGSGVARLLIHHKRQLGCKVVEEARLMGFRGVVPAIDGEPSLVFKIGDRGERKDRDEGDKELGMGRGENEDDEDIGFWVFDLD